MRVAALMRTESCALLRELSLEALEQVFEPRSIASSVRARNRSCLCGWSTILPLLGNWIAPRPLNEDYQLVDKSLLLNICELDARLTEQVRKVMP